MYSLINLWISLLESYSYISRATLGIGKNFGYLYVRNEIRYEAIEKSPGVLMNQASTNGRHSMTANDDSRV